jgi:hypothetical protein
VVEAVTEEEREDREDLEHEGHLRELTAKVMRESYLADDIETVERALVPLEDAHAFTHFSLDEIQKETMQALFSANFGEIRELKERAMIMSEFHFAVEYLHLIVKDHLRRLKGEEPLGDIIPAEAPAAREEGDNA